MRKTNTLLIIALALAMVASLALNQVNTVSAQGNPPVGVVIAYTPGQSITIVDQQGVQHEYQLSSSLMILPPGRADQLAVGSFVTVIASASAANGTPVAMGIVVHPQVPPGWNVSISPTAVGTETPGPTSTPTAVGTVSETSTPTTVETMTPTATATVSTTETATSTATAIGTETATSTPTSTPTATTTGSGTTITTNAVIEWLRALFRQLLTHS
jgi:hypothetical protein